jgi:hypothetical protein
MSKRQEKINERIKEQQGFISARRNQQLMMFEQAYEAGLRIYENNKDKMSPEDIATIEAMKADQLETLEKLRLEAHPRTEA